MSELKALWIPTRSGNSLHCYIKSEDLIIDKGENVAEDECRHVVGIADNCSNCPANGKCGHDYWTECGDAFLEWANEEAEC